MAHSNYTKRKEERLKKKRAEKDSIKAQYRAWAAQGVTKSSKRAIKQRRAKAAKRVGRRDPKCKNIGDLRSHPELAYTVFQMWQRQGLPKDGGLPHQYQGKYKGVMRQVYELATAPGGTPSAVHPFSRTNIERLTRQVLGI